VYGQREHVDAPVDALFPDKLGTDDARAVRDELDVELPAIRVVTGPRIAFALKDTGFDPDRLASPGIQPHGADLDVADHGDRRA